MKRMSLALLPLAAAAVLIYLLVETLSSPRDLTPPPTPVEDFSPEPADPAPPPMPDSAGIEAATVERSVVRGTVRILEGGGPVVNAEVQLWAGKQRKPTSLTTGADGTFRFEKVAPGSARLRIRTGQYIDPSMRTVQVIGGVDAVVDFELARGATVSGRVTDKISGRTLGGVDVKLQGSSQKSAVTGPDGVYEIVGLGPGLSLLTARADDYPSLRVPVSVKDGEFRVSQDIALVQGGSATGSVRDAAGRGVEGAIVSCPGQELDARAVSAADGTFSLRAVPVERTVWVSAEKPGFVAARSDPLQFKSGEVVTGLSLTLEAGGTVRGRVLRPDGGPSVGASVRLLPLPPYRWRGRMPTAKTGEDGSFELRPVPSGSYRISATLKGSMESRDDLPAVLDGAVVEGVELTLGTAESISGSVLDEGGKPLQGITVQARPAEPGPGARWGHARTAPDGTFVITGLGPGTYTIIARPMRGGTATERAGVSAGSEGLTLTLPAPGSISGVVHTSDGKPARSYSIRIETGDRTSRGGRYFQRVSSTNGRFSVTGVAPGTYVVTASGPDGFSEPVSGVVVAPGEDSGGLSLALQVGGSISGRLFSADGSPTSGARISVTGGAVGISSGNSTARTDDAGAFSVSGLRAGDYKVTASIAGLSVEANAVRVASGADTEVSLSLPELASLTVRIVDERGAPLGGVYVSVRTASGRFVAARSAAVSASLPPGERAAAAANARKRSNQTDARGVLVREGVPVGTLRVRAYRKGYLDVEQSVVVSPGKGAAVSITLRPGESSIDRKGERVR